MGVHLMGAGRRRVPFPSRGPQARQWPLTPGQLTGNSVLPGSWLGDHGGRVALSARIWGAGMGSHSDEAAGNSALDPSSALIDVHAHYVPSGWHAMPAAAAPLLRGFSSWSIPSALEMMDRQGIAVAVLSMAFWSGLFADPGDVAAARRLARSSNEGAAEAIRSHPDRFGGFACLPLPDVDGALAEIDYGLGTLGLDGVVLLTNADGVLPGRQPAGSGLRRAEPPPGGGVPASDGASLCREHITWLRAVFDRVCLRHHPGSDPPCPGRDAGALP